MEEKHYRVYAFHLRKDSEKYNNAKIVILILTLKNFFKYTIFPMHTYSCKN